MQSHFSVSHQTLHADRKKGSSLGTFNKCLPSGLSVLNEYTVSLRFLKDHLCESLKFRLLNIPEPPTLNVARNVRVAILFSGGLDCTILARMAHDLLPSDQHIDLLNVAFENPRVVQASKKPPAKSTKKNKIGSNPSTELSVDDGFATGPTHLTELTSYESCPDRVTGRKSLQELQHVCPGRVWRFIAVFSLNVDAHVNL